MKKYFCVLFFLCISQVCFTQICGTPGFDGPENIAQSINTYYPPSAVTVLQAGAKTVSLDAVPPNDAYGNNFGTVAIKAGDLLLIIQMQDATIQFSNDNLYGANSATSGPDALGGTGYTSLGNSGRFEYVIATNPVPLTGGTLTFKGAGPGNGVVFSYDNAPATTQLGKRTFQVVRVPQYSNLVLSSNISTPPFNGRCGGIIAFDVAGDMNFNSHSINASSRGFRGGYGVIAPSAINLNNLYVTGSTDIRSVGKGEGIVGTPRYMWDGFNQVDNMSEGLPGGSYGKGAPGNAGGGGNDHNAGGGGGGNGGAGGVGGNGTNYGGSGPGAYPNGGRPGAESFNGPQPDITRLIMGGGGGGGDANDALTGVKGGVGGGIILINVGSISGNGTILANGGNGAIGVAGNNPDGAGGGGAGGTVFIKVSNANPSTVLDIQANGGDGGNTERDTGTNDEHGTGGGAGGGQVFIAMATGTVQVKKSAGKAGRTNSGAGSTHGAADGKDGNFISFDLSALPAYLQGGGSGCYPRLHTTFNSIGQPTKIYPGDYVFLEIRTTNMGGGNAGGVRLELQMPAGISVKASTPRYSGNAGGPPFIFNQGSGSLAWFGDFNISPGDSVAVTLTLLADCNMPPGKYSFNAQAIYLDPSRTFRDANRRITGAVAAFTGANTTYETGIAGAVPGSNYKGSPASPDVEILPFIPLSNNNIGDNQPQVRICQTGDPLPVTGTMPAGGNGTYTYQWQQSADSINFTSVVSNGTSMTYDPPVLAATTFYRRLVSSGNCLSPLTSNVVKIEINQKPVPDFSLPAICLRDGAATFDNLTTISGSFADLQYTWNFGDVLSPLNTSVLFTGSHRYGVAGIYQVSLQAVSGACTATITKPFTLNGSIPKAAFEFAAKATLCSDTTLRFKDLATVDFGEITRIEWLYDVSGNAVPPQVDSNPASRNAAAKLYSHQYPVFYTPAVKNTTVQMKVFSGISCFDSVRVVVQLKAVPEVVFNNLTAVCNNAPPFVITQAKEKHGILTGAGFYFGGGITGQANFSPALANVGSNKITYTYVADNGCSASQSQSIIVNQSPTVIGGRAEVLQGGQIQLPAIYTGNILTYKWIPAQYLDRDNVSNPVASPVKDILYRVTVSSAAGCVATDTVFVKVFLKPTIPNAFSPNGDGINDVWNIQNLNTYAGAEVLIYNRYGQLMYQSKGYTTPWNGTHNGKALPVGTYYYVINTQSGHKPFTGSVTLLR